MTPQQRMLAAIRGEPVDRLPFATYNCHPFSWGRYVTFSHGDWPEYRPIIEAVARTGAGMLCKVSAKPTGGLPCPKVTTIMQDGQEVRTEVLETPAGPLRRVYRKPSDQPGMWTEHYIKTDADIERFASLTATPVRWDVTEVLAACDEIGSAGLAYVDYDDPFYSIASRFDQEEFLIRMHTNPATIMELIEQTFIRFRDDLMRLLEMLSDSGQRLLFYTAGPELATPPLLPPEVFAQVITPYHTKLVALIHEYGFPVSMHCHGRVRQVLGEVLKCGFDVLEPIEPPPQGDINLAELRAAAGDSLTLVGYVQDQEFYTASPRQIRSRVAEIAAVIGRESRYIATPTCTPFDFPPTRTYVDNYVAFLQAAEELGA